MPFNGSGVFQRVHSWIQDRNDGVRIRADRHDAEDDNLAAGLSNCIARDGQSVIAADIPFNGRRITGLGDAQDPTDALNKRSADGLYMAGGASAGLAGVNLLLNGNFEIAQRGSTGLRTDGEYGFDRWYGLNPLPDEIANIGTHVGATQIPGGGGQLDLAQNTPICGLAQFLESADTVPLRGRAVTFTGRIGSSVSRTVNWAILAQTGPAFTRDVVKDWSITLPGYPFFIVGVSVLAHGSLALTSASAAAGLPFTGSGSVPADATFLGVMVWTQDVRGYAANRITLHAMELQVGTNPSPNARRPIALEVALCQRTFQALDGGLRGVVTGPDTVGRLGEPLRMPMRAVPSVSLAGAIYDGAAVATSPVIIANYSQPGAVEIDVHVSGGLTPGRAAVLFTPSIVHCDAEL
ncbi:MAG: hypothetical protein ABWY78_13335 [Microvirga sp.]